MALHNDYRPQRLSDIFGQDNTVRILKNAVANGRISEYQALLFIGSRGCGKAQPLDALVLTPWGWSRMEDIKTGDAVIAGDGSVTRVIGVFPQGKKDIYRVSFSDGSSTECCDEHLWHVKSARDRKFRRSGRAMQLSDIRRYLLLNNGHGRKMPNYSIPTMVTAQFSRQSVPLDPYLLGVLIGDAYLSNKKARLSSVDSELLTTIRKRLPREITLNKVAGDNCDYDITGGQRGGTPNPVTVALRDLGLAGCLSEKKFVPDCYLFNSTDIRIAVLQGLLDTDGSLVRGSGGVSIEFSSASPKLADDVVFLVRSLGGYASLSTGDTSYVRSDGQRIDCQKRYRVRLSLPSEVAPFTLPRKQSLVKPRSESARCQTYVTRYMTDAEYVGRKETQCILVQHPSHLYVTNGFIVTHNTTTARIIAHIVNCESLVDGEPCMKCAACQQVSRQIKYGGDIVEVDAASKNKVDDIDRILDSTQYNPSGVIRKKVYILDEAHQLSGAAKDRLLKTLEEPPSHVLFILATTESHKIPATIKSRCIPFTFKEGSPKDIAAYLKTVCDSYGVEYEEDALVRIGGLAGGAYRDALGLMEKCIDGHEAVSMVAIDGALCLPGREYVIGAAKAVVAGDQASCFRITNEVLEMGKDVRLFLKEVNETLLKRATILAEKNEMKTPEGLSIPDFIRIGTYIHTQAGAFPSELNGIIPGLILAGAAAQVHELKQ